MKNGQEIHYRDREHEVLFFDLRNLGDPYEKKYIELGDALRKRVADTYHRWQQEGYEETYHDEPEFCKSVDLATLKDKGYSLVPSKYIEFINRDEQIDFDAKMKQLQGEMRELLKQEEESEKELKELFEKLGYKL